MLTHDGGVILGGQPRPIVRGRGPSDPQFLELDPTLRLSLLTLERPNSAPGWQRSVLLGDS